MKKAVMSMIFNAPRMARYLSEIDLTSLAQGYAIPIKDWSRPGALQRSPLEGLPRRINVCRQYPAGGSPS
jgi:hypothetical protein